MARRTPGRPRGTPNRTYQYVAEHPGQCPTCQSTERTALPNPQRVEVPQGVDPRGRPCTHVTRRRVQCRQCGRVYILSTWENATTARHGPPDAEK